MENLFSIPPGEILLWFVVFLFSLSFHESAHAWTSYKFGDDTGRLQGRITMNPIAHIDPIGTILLPLMGFLSGGIAMFGWAKPVQTNPLLWREKTKANICVSGAGPISNFILVIISFITIKVLLIAGLLQRGYKAPFTFVTPVSTDSTLLYPVATILCIFLILNLTLGLFNLIPIPPLDGSHILESILPPQIAEAYAQIRPFGFLILIALMWTTPIFSWIFLPIFQLVLSLLY
ncbi:MAG: site-2 protease family protein [Acidobacteriota bacterium]